MHEGSVGAFEETGPMSAQKALQGFKNDTRELVGGRKENNVLPDDGSLICPHIKMILCRDQMGKNEKVARPATAALS